MNLASHKTAAGLYSAGSEDHKGNHLYCGRECLMTVTGASSPEVTRLINEKRNRPHDRQVKATCPSELKHALSGLRASHTSERIHGYRKEPTLAQWLRCEQHSRRDSYIILITGHWIVVKGDWLVDTFHRDGHDLSRNNPYARRRVKYVIRVRTD